MDPFWLNTGLEIVKAVFGVLVPVATIILSFYAKRFSDKLKRQSLLNEVSRLVQYAKEAKSFQLLNMEEKKATIFDSVSFFALDNDIKVTDEEIKIMIDRSIQSLRSLDNISYKLLKSKEK